MRTLQIQGDAVDAAEVVRTIGGRAEMLEVMQEVLGEDRDLTGMHHGIPPEDLLRTSAGKATYRLRYVTCGFPIEGIKGKISRNQFRGMVRAALHHNVRHVRALQPGQWRIVAVSVHESYKQRWRRVATGISEEESQHNPIVNGIPRQNKQQHELVLGKDPRLQLQLALAEVTQSDPIDLVFEREGKRTSSMRAYVESGGLLKHMSPKLAQQRAEAIRVIKEFADLPDDIEAKLFELSQAEKDRALGLAEVLDPSEIAAVLRCPEEAVHDFLESQTKPKGKKP